MTNRSNKISIRNLESFVVVARSASIGKAAETLHIAQPALSQQLHLMEERLGVVLLEPDARPFRLTEAGKLLAADAERLVQRFDTMVEQIQAVATGKRGWLGIGYTRSAMYRFLPPIIRAFAQAYPDVTLKLHEMLTEDQPDALKAGTIHVGLARDPTPLPGIDCHTLARERLVVAMPSYHPLAAQGPLSLSALADEPFILFPSKANAAFPARVSALCQGAGFIPRWSHSAEEIQSALGFVAAGLGVTLIAASAGDHQRADVCFVTLIDDSEGIDTELVALVLSEQGNALIPKILALMRQAAP